MVLNVFTRKQVAYVFCLALDVVASGSFALMLYVVSV